MDFSLTDEEPQIIILKSIRDQLGNLTGDVHGRLTGTYNFNNKNSSLSPNEPVYKLEGQDRFNYYSPSEGEKVDLSGETDGHSYYSGKNFIILIKMCLQSGAY